jgi:hypothetical protein
MCRYVCVYVLCMYSPHVHLYHTIHYYSIKKSQLLRRSSLFSQLTYDQLSPYDLQHRYEKDISSCIHDKSILLLGHLGAFFTRIKKIDN